MRSSTVTIMKCIFIVPIGNAPTAIGGFRWALCISVALFIYITSVDLSLVPRRHPHSVPVSQ